YYNLNVQKNLLMFGELKKILQTFKKNNIVTIPYKGPLLSIEEYGNLSLREFNDLDIFIDFQDLNKVKDLLIEYNYLPDIRLEKDKEREYVKTQRDFKFFNMAKQVTLEIHWTFNNLYLSLPKNQKL